VSAHEQAPVKLYTYWRSSAAYRVRIVLHLKGIDFESIAIDLAPSAHEQHSEAFSAVSVEGRVPVLEHGGLRLTQSPAIIEYLEECYPSPPLLAPGPAARAAARAMASLIACDIHPLNNVSVLGYLRDLLQADRAAVDTWYRHWVHRGFAALESRLARTADAFCCGDAPGLTDVFLVPQVYNAVRFHCDMERFPTIARINARCLALEAFDRARPEVQPDAPPS
jgi:maleylacetoacetate isomerase